MKKYHAIIMLALLTFSSCKDLDGDISSLKADPYAELFDPLMDENDAASIYGTVNNKDEISVIASGSAFEVSGVPQEIFLAPFPGGSIGAMENSIGVLRDVIPYTHEEYKDVYKRYYLDNGVPYILFGLELPEHSMTYSVKQGTDMHTVCVTFGATDGRMEFRPVGSMYYWVYLFTLDIVKMTVDGEERPVPERHTLNYRLYYNREKDSIG